MKNETPNILEFFEYHHLPSHLKGPSEACYTMAHSMVERLNGSAELSAGLRKLLEAKDCFVRAAMLSYRPGIRGTIASVRESNNVITEYPITVDNPFGLSPEERAEKWGEQ